MAARKKPALEPVPHSWDIEHWPASVYPHSPSRARYLFKTHKLDLLDAGAVTRVGRELVFIGVGYNKFLAKLAKHVAGYEIPPNQQQSAA
jgi:hypothetical protein